MQARATLVAHKNVHFFPWLQLGSEAATPKKMCILQKISNTFYATDFFSLHKCMQWTCVWFGVILNTGN